MLGIMQTRPWSRSEGSEMHAWRQWRPLTEFFTISGRDFHTDLRLWQFAQDEPSIWNGPNMHFSFFISRFLSSLLFWTQARLVSSLLLPHPSSPLYADLFCNKTKCMQAEPSDVVALIVLHKSGSDRNLCPHRGWWAKQEAMRRGEWSCAPRVLLTSYYPNTLVLLFICKSSKQICFEIP